MKDWLRRHQKLLIILVVTTSFITIRSIVGEDTAGDFADYFYPAGKILNEGKETTLYNRDAAGVKFVYPPFFGILLMPFALLPPRAAEILWVDLIAVFYVLTVMLTWRVMRSTSNRVGRWVLFLPILFTGRTFVNNINTGQANLLMIFATTLSVYWFDKGRDFRAGIAAAFAACVKFTPGLLILYFLFRRSRRAGVGSAVGLALFLIIVPVLVFGFADAGAMVREMLTPDSSFLFQAVRDDTVPGLSIRSILMHYLCEIGVSRDATDRNPTYVNIANFDPRAIEVLALLVVLGLLVVLARTFGSGTPGRQTTTIHLEYALVLTGMLLFSPLSRKAHFTLLCLPVGILGQYALQFCPSGRRKKFLIACLGIAFVLICLPSRGIVGRHVSDFCSDNFSIGWGTLALWVGMLSAYRESRKSTVSTSREPAG